MLSISVTLIEIFLKLYARYFPNNIGKLRLVNFVTPVITNGRSPLRQARLVHGGYIIPVDLNYLIQRQLYFFGDYWLEKELITRWKIHARASSTIVDVGANRGIYSLAAASVNKQARIFAFEPTAEIASALRLDLSNNAVPNVTVCEEAVSSHQSGAVLNYCDGGGKNDGMNYISPPATADGHDLNLAHVSTTTIDEFCEQYKIHQIDLIKVDVQGAELEVLKGATNMLQRRMISVIFIELNQNGQGWDGVGKAVVECLAQYGFVFSSQKTSWTNRPAGEWLFGCSDVIATLQATQR